MNIYQFSDGLLVDEFPKSPYTMIDQYFSLFDYAEARKGLEEMILSACSERKARSISEHPSYFLFSMKQLTSLIVATYLIIEKGLDKKPTASDGPRIRSHPVSLMPDEALDPYRVFKEAHQFIPLEDWLAFLDQCTSNCLAGKGDPEWDGIQKQVLCTAYLKKLYDAAFLVYTHSFTSKQKGVH